MNDKVVTFAFFRNNDDYPLHYTTAMPIEELKKFECGKVYGFWHPDNFEFESYELNQIASITDRKTKTTWVIGCDDSYNLLDDFQYLIGIAQSYGDITEIIAEKGYVVVPKTTFKQI